MNRVDGSNSQQVVKVHFERIWKGISGMILTMDVLLGSLIWAPIIWVHLKPNDFWNWHLALTSKESTQIRCWTANSGIKYLKLERIPISLEVGMHWSLHDLERNPEPGQEPGLWGLKRIFKLSLSLSWGNRFSYSGPSIEWIPIYKFKPKKWCGIRKEPFNIRSSKFDAKKGAQFKQTTTTSPRLDAEGNLSIAN